MNYIQTLYNKIWSSLIWPPKRNYQEHDLGHNFFSINQSHYQRFDCQLKNAFKERFKVSVFHPCDQETNLKQPSMFLVYCHSHSGSRIEGLQLLENLHEKNTALITFDFWASGYSSGRYLTLGWFEALDLNAICQFILKEFGVNKICLWGRSMGGCAILLFLSGKYWRIIDSIFYKNNIEQIDWVDQSLIQGVLIDSTFTNLNQTIHNMINNKYPLVPNYLIKIVTKVLEKEIQQRTGIQLSLLNPIDFAGDINNQIMMIFGKNDELTKIDHFLKLFESIPSMNKKVEIFMGNHTDERPHYIQMKAIDFLHKIKYQKQTNNDFNVNQIRSSEYLVLNNDLHVVQDSQLDTTQVQQINFQDFCISQQPQQIDARQGRQQTDNQNQFAGLSFQIERKKNFGFLQKQKQTLVLRSEKINN